MIWTIYIIILVYFALGSIGFYFINKKRTAQQARKNIVKLATYFVIVNIIFFSIIFDPRIFRILCLVIIIAGCFELIKLFVKSNYRKKLFFLLFLAGFGIFSYAFYFFGGIDKEVILFTFIIISIFDSFSQISGQLWGNNKLLSDVSPNKTTEGLTGGVIVTMVSSILLRNLADFSTVNALWMAAGIILFAIFGDLMASWYKRQYNKKDFSRLIPGHGGFIDRFDSLITAGAWVALISQI